MWTVAAWRIAPFVLLLACPGALAQLPDTAESQPQAPPAGAAERPSQPGGVVRLPGEITTIQYVELPERRFQIQATAGALPLYDGDGSLQAEIAYIAYVKSDAQARSLTFVFNGGPGAASAYLHLGALGPWRLPLDQLTPSAAPTLIANAETWLDFTDLVFIDPPGAGYSRIAAAGEAPRRQLWSVDGDAEAVAVFIRKWIQKYARQASPKFIVGESYGGFRAPKVARALQEGQNVGVNGLVLISPVLDFGVHGLASYSPLPWAMRLPSLAATAREAQSGFDAAALHEVEEYAIGDYLRDLMRGPGDVAAIERMTTRVAAFTGLDLALVRRLGGRVDAATFKREFYRQQGLVASDYDATVTAADPNPNAARSDYSDPMLGAISAPLTNAMTDLYQRVLRWRIDDQPYWLQNGEANGRWNWGRRRTPPQVVDDLIRVLANDRNLRVLVTQGASDLITPYFETKFILGQLPTSVADRVAFALYGGGHMHYSRDASRRALHDDAEALVRAASPAPSSAAQE